MASARKSVHVLLYPMEFWVGLCLNPLALSDHHFVIGLYIFPAYPQGRKLLSDQARCSNHPPWLSDSHAHQRSENVIGLRCACMTCKDYRTQKKLYLLLAICWILSYTVIERTTTTTTTKGTHDGLSDYTQQCSRVGFLGRYSFNVDYRWNRCYRSYQRNPTFSRTLQRTLYRTYSLGKGRELL